MSKRSVGALVSSGLRFSADALHGRASLGLGWREFAGGILQALRPHYFALPAGACLAGAAVATKVEDTWRVAVAAAAAGVGWGVGQLLNDLMDTEADAVDAPDRPAVRGLLPDGPTMVVAMLLGLLVAAATVLIHPEAYWLAVVAAGLLVAYGPAKRVPLLGNLTHGALPATAAAIGCAAAAPSEPLLAVLARVWPVCGLIGAWAAIFLQANYEKDRRGDAQANVHTLAHVLGLRTSAVVRLAGALGVGVTAVHLGALHETAALLSMATAFVLVSVSAGRVLRRSNEAAALAGYRFAVHAATTGMLAMAGNLLGNLAILAAIAVSVLLTEFAFRKNATSA